MFCTQCGGTLDASTGICPACAGPSMAGQHGHTSATSAGAPLVGRTWAVATDQARVAPQVAAKMREASRDATQAFRTFATDPVGGLPVAFESLGQSRAMAVGIVFAVVSILCVFIGVYITLPAFSKPDFGDSLKFILFGAVPFVSILAASTATRKVFRGEGSFGGDSLLAGASLLPLGFLVLLTSVLGLANLEVAALLFIFALGYGILMLYTGVTRISKVSESRAAFAVPVMIIVSFWLTKVIFGAMLPSFLPSPAKLFPF